MKTLLSMAIAAALMTVGSLKAVEETKLMPHHENGRFTPGHTAEDHKHSTHMATQKHSAPHSRNMRAAQMTLSPSEQEQLDANISDLRAVESENKLTGGVANYLAKCDAVCNGSIPCGPVTGIANAGSHNIPVDRAAFLSCFRSNWLGSDGGPSKTFYWTACDAGCPAFKCGNDTYRQACRLLCCGVQQQWGYITNCLAKGQDSCYGY